MARLRRYGRMIRPSLTALALLMLAACDASTPPAPDSQAGAAAPVATPAQPPKSRLPAQVTVSTNEPFWQAAIDGDTVVLTGVDSPRRSFAIVDDAVDGDRRRVSARDGKGSLRVEVVDRPCVNDMSGASFPLSGSLTIDGNGPFRGCAAPPGYRPLAEPETPGLTAIPDRFVGLWAADADGCRVPPASIEWVRVTPQSLRFHESLATPRSIRARGDAVEIEFDFEGEGQQWQSTKLLQRTGDTLLIEDAEAPPIRRIRCVTGDEAAAVPEAEKTPAAAREVVLRYYSAIDRGDYGAAYELWSRRGAASGKSSAAFAQGFAQTVRSRVTAGAPVNSEGAAGSLFIEVPVQVAATLRDGAEQRFAGSYVLRRVNDVPGASPEQLRWRIDHANLRAVR